MKDYNLICSKVFSAEMMEEVLKEIGDKPYKTKVFHPVSPKQFSTVKEVMEEIKRNNKPVVLIPLSKLQKLYFRISAMIRHPIMCWRSK